MKSSTEESAARLLVELKNQSRDRDVEALVRRHFEMVYSTCLRITRNRHDAEDAAQAVFLSLALQLRDHRQIKAVGPWLYQVACRASLDICRKRKRRTNHENAFAAQSPQAVHDQAAKADFDEIRPVVVLSLNELPARYRLPLILHYFGGLSHEEISGELGCSRATLRVRMHRGHAMLRKTLRDRGIHLAGGVLGAALAAAVHWQISDALLGTTANFGARMASAGVQVCAVTPEVLATACRLGIPRVARLKVLILLGLLASGAVAAATPLLAKLQDRWPTLPAAPSLRDLAPAIKPTFISPLPSFSDGTPTATPNVTPASEPSNAPPRLAATPTHQTPPRNRPGEIRVQVPAFAGIEPARPKPAIPATPVPRYTGPTLPQAVPAGRPAPLEFFLIPRDVPSLAAQQPRPAEFVSRPSASFATRENTQAAPVTPVSPIFEAPPPVDPTGAATDPPGPYQTAPDPTEPVTSVGGTVVATVWDRTTTHPAVSPIWQPPVAHDSTSSVGVAPSSSAITRDVEYLSPYYLDSMGRCLAYVQQPHSNTITIRHSELTNNGQTIANGTTISYGEGDVIRHTVPNTSGVNGWFAVNRGKITLPPIHLVTGEHRYNWGDQADATSIDLINSLSFMADARTPATLSISLLAADHPVVPVLPDSHHFAGIWQLSSDTPIASGLDLTIRYDDTYLASRGLDENNIKLWYYDTSWHRVTDDSFSRDITLNQVSGHIPTAHFFAVSTPEPSAAGLTLIAAGAALLRRTRRR